MRLVSQIGHHHARRRVHIDAATTTAYADGVAVGFATVVDALLVAAWITLAADNLLLARRERAARARLGPVVGGGTGPGLAVRAGVLVVLLGGGALLEAHTGGRLAFHPVAAIAGVALAAAGVALHLRARRSLGHFWSGPVAVRARHTVVTGGPYALVRHPLYLGILLLAAGSALAHPSLAVVCAAAGLAAGIAYKIPVEERVLRATCGDAYARYAAEVPALVPRLLHSR
jgi:protein-S-isoprenylcysteine O-methyltransferase Ste14